MEAFLRNVAEVQRSRRNYLQDPTDDGREDHLQAVTNLMSSYALSFDRATPNGRFKAISYKSDGILTPRELAQVNAPYQAREASAENREKPPVITVSQKLNKAIATYKSGDISVPESVVSSLQGNWKQVSSGEKINSLLSVAEDSITRLLFMNGSLKVSDGIRKGLANRVLLRALDNFNSGSSNGAKTRYAELKNNDTGDIIRVYAARKNSKNLIGTEQDIKMVEESISQIRQTTTLTKPLKLSLVGGSTSTVDYTGGPAGSGTMGFAFPGAGAHIVVPAVKNATDRKVEDPNSYNPETSFHSVPQADYRTGYIHTAVHEIGHILMYQYWGSDTLMDDGKTPLSSDYKKFGVTGQSISRYGKKSVAEHFAEAYARYVMTGDATPEFRNLLASKGLLKSQQEG